jgi:hypothetical protein
VDSLIRLCRRYETRVSTRKRKRHSSIKVEMLVWKSAEELIAGDIEAAQKKKLYFVFAVGKSLVSPEYAKT